MLFNYKCPIKGKAPILFCSNKVLLNNRQISVCPSVCPSVCSSVHLYFKGCSHRSWTTSSQFVGTKRKVVFYIVLGLWIKDQACEFKREKNSCWHDKSKTIHLNWTFLHNAGHLYNKKLIKF